MSRLIKKFPAFMLAKEPLLSHQGSGLTTVNLAKKYHQVLPNGQYWRYTKRTWCEELLLHRIWDRLRLNVAGIAQFI